ncbi:hypothetical protein QL285_053678 [Trifolium repens]|nr:hypothetical protein QL285_053678 [Trifolium repens]
MKNTARSSMHLSNPQNDTVCTQPILEPTAKKRHQLISPAGDGLYPRLPEELILDILLRLPETFMEVLLPKDGNDICTSRKLCVSNNCLYVCEFYISGDFRWVYWLMKEYGVVESWTKLMIISNSGLLNPLFISENGCVLVDGFTSKLIRYNLYSGEFDYPCILRSSFLRLNQHIYCESLVSL